MKQLIYFAVPILLMFSCGKKNRFSDVDLSNTPAKKVEIVRFDADFFAIDTNNIAGSLAELKEKHSQFANFYLKQIIGISNMDENKVIGDFLTHPAYREFYSAVIEKYKDVSDLEDDFALAFQYINYYFPNIHTPSIYTHFSGFGDMIVVDENLLSISLDYYLGSDYENYKYVDGIYGYMTPNYRREKIVSDAIFWWLTTEFPYHLDAPRLLDNMIYYGKIMYLTEVILPNETEENLIGYSKEQWDWVRTNESKMWNYMMEHKHLFSTESLITAKYINPAPFTSFFPEDSPGRTGIWIGWQIVRSYMEKQKETTLPQLMSNHNAQDILENSGYMP